MSTRWEVRHGLNPQRDDARGDLDADGLRNLAEFVHDSLPEDEDTDNDGHDDGDEVHDSDGKTQVKDRDTDDDGVQDGDENSDHDGTANEDEDDAAEPCAADDDDRDNDHVTNEDENDFGYRADDDDSDDDGVLDGDEDHDGDGQHDEDDDDSDDDRCSRDGGEDAGDLLGVIASFEAGTGDLVISTRSATTITFVVTDDTEIEIERPEDEDRRRGGLDEGSTADLVTGAPVLEVDLEDDGTLEEIELGRH